VNAVDLESALELKSKWTFRGNNTTALRLKQPGLRTYCQDAARTDLDFGGGALMTEALVDALEKYAGEQEDGDFVVKLRKLRKAVDARIIWWRDLYNHHGETPPEFEFSFEPQVTKIAKSKTPRVMIDMDVCKRGGKSLASAPYVSVVPESTAVALVGYAGCTHKAVPPVRAPMARHRDSWRADIDPGICCGFQLSNQTLPHSFKKISPPGIVQPDQTWDI